jgi:hypothetical protein
MNAVFVLLVLSAIVGLVLGFFFSWIAILVSGLVLAVLSATVLQNEDFGFLAGIAIIVICLTVNQVSYLIGEMLARGPQDPLAHDRLNDDPGENSQHHVSREQKQNEQPPTQFGPRSLRGNST